MLHYTLLPKSKIIKKKTKEKSKRKIKNKKKRKENQVYHLQL